MASKLDDEFPTKVQLLTNQVYAWTTMVEAKLANSARYERDHVTALDVRYLVTFECLAQRFNLAPCL